MGALGCLAMISAAIAGIIWPTFVSTPQFDHSEDGVSCRVVSFEEDSTFGLAVTYPLAQIDHAGQLRFDVKLDPAIQSSWTLARAQVLNENRVCRTRTISDTEFAKTLNYWVADCPAAGSYAVEVFLAKNRDDVTTSELRAVLSELDLIRIEFIGEG